MYVLYEFINYHYGGWKSWRWIACACEISTLCMIVTAAVCVFAGGHSSSTFLTKPTFQTLLTAAVDFRCEILRIVCLFIWASQLLSRCFCIIRVSTNTNHPWFLYEFFTFSSGASEPTEIVFSQLVCCGILWLLILWNASEAALLLLFATVAQKKKKTLTSECLFVALKFCTCPAPFKLLSMVLEVASRCSSCKVCYL